ncbi:6,7-dimethyl-8-ribityllumazine synthase [Enterobacteriaceae bacterium ET-AT1-13]|nr:6,7-dimethyl-8-ribityllumazine synthase [Enterobacteriaceae bacterium ET-AT1-13]WGS66439.1 6,7-dimethyl-8-ribityllumazine synthase [Enterobacteriaceae bacterium Cmel17]WMC17464.1 MAG: 6,7-dimethyl-8-ribityllumazine synthase [Enterobacteriaceae bacterium Cmel21]WMC17671.1 MAG: 6,7-dimethyl-8-ribityllumazine synthase [Enterobacteriaceae bacterium PSmelAO3-2]WMC17875.1 MAG: 6,7-dimethyl-8-ribityllumazine synthase [Enterobacteriaceae bacterium PSmelAO3-1]WMC18079.1 MAG: 6,7-dimethyl-8-ribityllu
MKIINSTFNTSNSTIAIVISRFNEFINKSLLKGSIDILKRIGKISDNNITIVWVPGAYEIPLITQLLANSKKYKAIITLGTIIKGETKHFEYISNSIISNISNIILKTEIPIILGILTTNNIEQAINRSGCKSGNKGIDAALNALEMINIINNIKNKNI